MVNKIVPQPWMTTLVLLWLFASPLAAGAEETWAGIPAINEDNVNPFREGWEDLPYRGMMACDPYERLNSVVYLVRKEKSTGQYGDLCTSFRVAMREAGKAGLDAEARQAATAAGLAGIDGFDVLYRYAFGVKELFYQGGRREQPAAGAVQEAIFTGLRLGENEADYIRTVVVLERKTGHHTPTTVYSPAQMKDDPVLRGRFISQIVNVLAYDSVAVLQCYRVLVRLDPAQIPALKEIAQLSVAPYATSNLHAQEDARYKLVYLKNHPTMYAGIDVADLNQFLAGLSWPNNYRRLEAAIAALEKQIQEVSAGSSDLGSIRRKLEFLESARLKLTRKIAELEQLRTQVGSVSQAVQQHETTIQTLNRTIGDLQAGIRKLEAAGGDQEALRKRIKDLEEADQRRDERIRALQDGQTSQDQEIAWLKKQAEDQDKAIKELRATLEALSQMQGQVTTIQETVDTLRGQVTILQNLPGAIAGLKSSLGKMERDTGKLTTKLEALMARVDKLTTSSETLQQRQTEMQTTLQKLPGQIASDLTSVRKQIHDLETSRDGLQSAIQEVREANGRQDKRLDDLEQALQGVNEELLLLQNHETRLNQMGKDLKALGEAQETLRQRLGELSGIPGQIQQINRFLSQLQQEDLLPRLTMVEQTVQNLVSLQGTVTQLLGQVTSQGTAISGLQTTVNELRQADQEIRDLISGLTARVVALEGSLPEKLRERLEKLEKSNAELTTAVNALSAMSERVTQISSRIETLATEHVTRFEKIEKDITTLRQEVNTAIERVRQEMTGQMGAMENRLLAKIKIVEDGQADQARTMKAMNKRIDDLAKILGELTTRFETYVGNNDQVVADLRAQIGTVSQVDFAALQTQANATAGQVEILQGSLTNLEKTVKDLQTRVDGALDQIQALEKLGEQVTTLENASRTMNATLTDHETRIKTVEGRVDKLVENHGQMQQALGKAQDDLDKATRDLAAQDRAIQGLDKRIQELKAKDQQIDGEIARLNDQLAKDREAAQKNIAALNKEINALKLQITSLPQGASPEEIKAQQAKVDGLEGRVNTLAGDVAGIVIRVNEIDTRLKSLEGRVEAMDKRLKAAEEALTKLQKPPVSPAGTSSYGVVQPAAAKPKPEEAPKVKKKKHGACQRSDAGFDLGWLLPYLLIGLVCAASRRRPAFGGIFPDRSC